MLPHCPDVNINTKLPAMCVVPQLGWQNGAGVGGGEAGSCGRSPALL